MLCRSQICVFHARQAISREAFVQARLRGSADGRPGAAWQNLTPQQMALAAAHADARAAALRAGRPIPPAPAALDQDARTFVESISRTAQAAEHTTEHAKLMRKRVYALSYLRGTGTWWITFSPYPELSFRIYRMSQASVLPPSDDPSAIPFLTVRFGNIGSYPGGSALFFEQVCLLCWHPLSQCKCTCTIFIQVMEVFVRYIVGWDSAQQRPLVHGGILGVPVDYVGVIEEQKSMALHGHFMLWMMSFSDVINRLLDTQATNPVLYEHLANELSDVLRSLVIAELRLTPLRPDPPLSEPASNLLHTCPDCQGELGQIPVAELTALRNRNHTQGEDPAVLVCTNQECMQRYSSYAQLYAALTRMGGTHNSAELQRIMWNRLPFPPPNSSEADLAHYNALLASLQVYSIQYQVCVSRSAYVVCFMITARC